MLSESVQMLMAVSYTHLFEGQRVVISGSGNVATYANQKATQMGGKVIAMSDSNGYIAVSYTHLSVTLCFAGRCA